MYQFIAIKASFRIVAATLLCAVASSTFADKLTIEEAGQLALLDDYTLRAINARSESMAELAIAAEGLPDPQLKLGFANLPTDTFNLGQEPMTQAVIGVRQMFPRGQTRSLSSLRVSKSVASTNAKADDRKQQLLLSVREGYTQIYLHQQREQILRQSLVVFSDLAEITRDYYASGRAQQQDVVQTELELSRVEERLARITDQTTGKPGPRTSGRVDWCQRLSRT